MAADYIIIHKWHDWIPAPVKIAFKRLFYPAKSAYQMIVNGKDRRATWMLGMQPDRAMMHDIERRYSKILLLSILNKRELIVSDEELARVWPNWSRLQLQWYDHSVCSPIDGRNQSLASFKGLLSSVYDLWLQSDCKLFYCHCMAGRGRSFLFVLAWLLYYSGQLNRDLQNGSPNLSELSKFISQLRPQVFGLEGLEGEQRGFAGLLALDWLAGKPLEWWQRRDPIRLQMDLQCAGMALAATLDNTYRLGSDIKMQQDNAARLFYLAQRVNIRRDVLEFLLWTPPWNVLETLVSEFPLSKLQTLKQQSWMALPAVARANWQRWQYWWFTAD